MSVSEWRWKHVQEGSWNHDALLEKRRMNPVYGIDEWTNEAQEEYEKRTAQEEFERRIASEECHRQEPQGKDEEEV